MSDPTKTEEVEEEALAKLEKKRDVIQRETKRLALEYDVMIRAQETRKPRPPDRTRR
jgi:hypothetical protein